MDRIAKLKSSEREELFILTAYEMRLPEAMAEKDFWVCWILYYLFSKSPWSKQLAFKGGTSLSKCYGLIERFSEDIDLILDWRVLGFSESFPWAERSNTSQDKLNKDMDAKSAVFLKETLLPKMKLDFKYYLAEPFELYINDDEPQTVCYAYPRLFENQAIVNIVRMEIGSLAAWTPTSLKLITPYAAEKFPDVFQVPAVNVLTVMAKRTFWEKVTILHKEAYRTRGKFPSRYSRHYYDLFCMDKTTVKEDAYNDLKLLEQVVVFKSRFYPAKSARYDLAKPGTMKLLPNDESMDILKDDYNQMRDMIFGHAPSFEEIIKTLERMETEINKLN